jgi:serine/threonine-protein kinase
MVQLRAGQVIDGRYRIDRKLGAGGMGIVFSAVDLTLGGTVAIKVMRKADSAGDDVERFMREVVASERLTGPHVVRTMGSGWLDATAPYLVMEYVDGEPVSKRLSREGPLPVADAVACAICVCDALAEAHAVGIVHRDVKPANMLLAGGDPHATKLADFGTVKLASPELTAITTTNCVIGSVAYVSPEQIATPKDVDARSDIWSLGVTLYMMLAGRTPFGNDEPIVVYQRILNETPSPLHAVRADVPRELSAIVVRCLRKEREERFGDARALAEALLPFARDRVVDGSTSTFVLAPQALDETLRARPPNNAEKADRTAPHFEPVDGFAATIAVHATPRQLVPAPPSPAAVASPGRSTPAITDSTIPAEVYLREVGYDTDAPASERRGLPALGAVAFVVFTLTLGGTLAWRYGMPWTPTARGSRPDAVLAPPATPPFDTSAPPAVATTATEPIATALVPSSPQAPPLGPTRVPSAPRRAVKPVEAKTSSATASCQDHPFVIDSEGIKSYRAECM